MYLSRVQENLAALAVCGQLQRHWEAENTWSMMMLVKITVTNIIITMISVIITLTTIMKNHLCRSTISMREVAAAPTRALVVFQLHGPANLQCDQCDLIYVVYTAFKGTLESTRTGIVTHSGERWSKCYHRLYASSLASNLRTHLKTIDKCNES